MIQALLLYYKSFSNSQKVFVVKLASSFKIISFHVNILLPYKLINISAKLVKKNGLFYESLQFTLQGKLLLEKVF